MAALVWCALAACFDYGGDGPGQSVRDGGVMPATGGGSRDAGLSTPQGVIDLLKASNAAQADLFSWSLALSADGRTLAVGAIEEDSSATGVDGPPGNDGAPSSGAVYVFVRVGSAWQQQAYLKASNSAPNLQFGESVSLSGDGNTLAVGAQYDRSGSTSPQDTSAFGAGATYVFTRQSGVWSQQAYLKAVPIRTLAWFGSATALSTDGNTLVVGARGFGSAYVFTRVGTNWTAQAELKASNHDLSATDFGRTVAISGDGNTIAAGWLSESSPATGVNGSQTKSTTAMASGAVYLFTKVGTAWTQQAYLKASNTSADDTFGASLSLNATGTTLAVGAPLEDSAATGVNGNQNDNTAPNAGAVYLFTRSGSGWSQQAYLKASDTSPGDEFGGSVSLSSSGDLLAVGAARESSPATGLDGTQANDTATARFSGAVYLFERQGGLWAQRNFVKASNTAAGAAFGGALSLSGDGLNLAVGSVQESSRVINSGAAYVYSLTGRGAAADGGAAPFDPPPQCVLKGCVPAQLVNDPECALGAQGTMQVSLSSLTQFPRTVTVSGAASTDSNGVTTGRPTEFRFQLLAPFPAGATAASLSPNLRGSVSKAVQQVPDTGLYRLSMSCFDSAGQPGTAATLDLSVSP